MSTTGVLELDGREIPLLERETVLEALERAGVDVASGCREGACAKCMLRADAPPPESQAGLRPTLRAQGFFLACRARPAGRLALRGAGAPAPIDARLERIDLVAADVARLVLVPLAPLAFRAGQYVDVLHPSGAARSYSIASLPADGVLELHVRKVEGGTVSGYLHALAPGATVRVRGPFGQCFHVADDPRKKLLLVGAGTGLAPLLGIARDALAHGHQGAIDLVHGGLDPGRLYLRDELARLAASAPSLRVIHCVLRGATAREIEGSLERVAVAVAGPLAHARAFLCGDGEIVHRLRRSLFLAGLPSAEIYADPFTRPAAKPA